MKKIVLAMSVVVLLGAVPASAQHTNLNDDTNEGIASESRQAFAVQYHPEAAPGPHDALHLFWRFRHLIESGRTAPVAAGVA